MQVTGIGGTSSGDTAGGVLVISSGQISAGGTGTVSVTGNGGTSPGLNYGIDVVLGGSITSNNGTVTVNGTGGTGTGLWRKLWFDLPAWWNPSPPEEPTRSM